MLYISASRAPKFGVAVFKASMLNCRGSMCHGHIYNCCYKYIKLIWGNGFARSMLNCRRGGVNLPWVDIHCAIYETYLV